MVQQTTNSKTAHKALSKAALAKLFADIGHGWSKAVAESPHPRAPFKFSANQLGIKEAAC